MALVAGVVCVLEGAILQPVAADAEAVTAVGDAHFDVGLGQAGDVHLVVDGVAGFKDVAGAQRGVAGGRGQAGLGLGAAFGAKKRHGWETCSHVDELENEVEYSDLLLGLVSLMQDLLVSALSQRENRHDATVTAR